MKQLTKEDQHELTGDSPLAGHRHRWPLAGDQLFVDFDLSLANVLPGSELAIGSAIGEATDQPHTGCETFVARFRTGRRTVRQLGGRTGPAAARDPRKGRSSRDDSSRERREEEGTSRMRR
jgi:hypothetical protein